MNENDIVGVAETVHPQTESDVQRGTYPVTIKLRVGAPILNPTEAEEMRSKSRRHDALAELMSVKRTPEASHFFCTLLTSFVGRAKFDDMVDEFISRREQA